MARSAGSTVTPQSGVTRETIHKEVTMKKLSLGAATCLFLALTHCIATDSLARELVRTVPAPVVGKVKTPPKLHRLPDLTITKIYSKQHLGKNCVWADIKNQGGPIPINEFNQANMRFYLTYINNSARGTGNNGYMLKYIDRQGVLAKPGGTVSFVAPGNLLCEGTLKVTVKVDLPLSGNGRIRESNEYNNEKTAVLHCP